MNTIENIHKWEIIANSEIPVEDKSTVYKVFLERKNLAMLVTSDKSTGNIEIYEDLMEQYNYIIREYFLI